MGSTCLSEHQLTPGSLALATIEADFSKIPSEYNLSLKLFMPEVVSFPVLSRDAFPSLSPVKGWELVVEAMVFELFFVKAMDNTIVSATLCNKQ